MPSKSSFDAVAINVFNAFGDLIESVTYTIVGAWNPVTETTTNTTETIRIAVSDASKAEGVSSRGGGAGKLDIMDGDLSAVVIKSEMTATPKIDDYLTLGGVNYSVRAAANSHDVVWKLSLRRL